MTRQPPRLGGVSRTAARGCGSPCSWRGRRPGRRGRGCARRPRPTARSPGGRRAGAPAPPAARWPRHRRRRPAAGARSSPRPRSRSSPPSPRSCAPRVSSAPTLPGASLVNRLNASTTLPERLGRVEDLHALGERPAAARVRRDLPAVEHAAEDRLGALRQRVADHDQGARTAGRRCRRGRRRGLGRRRGGRRLRLGLRLQLGRRRLLALALRGSGLAALALGRRALRRLEQDEHALAVGRRGAGGADDHVPVATALARPDVDQLAERAVGIGRERLAALGLLAARLHDQRGADIGRPGDRHARDEPRADPLVRLDPRPVLGRADVDGHGSGG